MKQARLFPKGPPDGDPDAPGPPPASREQLRSRRRWPTRAETFSIKRMPKRQLHLGRLLYPELTEEEQAAFPRPKVRGDCASVPRPCPFVSCKHHLYLDVSPRTGAIKMNRPELELDEMEESCSLDIADRGGETLENVGALMNLTRERVRQVEVKAFDKMEQSPQIEALRDVYGLAPRGKRRLPVLQSADKVKVSRELQERHVSLMRALAVPAEDFDVEGFVSDELDD